MIRRTITTFVLLTLGALTARGSAQSIDERLDDETFLQELGDLYLPEVLEAYLREHPAADDATRTMHDLARARMRLKDPDATLPARIDAIAVVLETRDRLIKMLPDDPRRARWLADQASDVYFEYLPLESSGLTTLAGLPSERQRTRARTAATWLDNFASQAEIAIERSLLAIESTPGYSDDLVLRQKRRQLVQEERESRIPFLRGMGAFLMAAVVAEGEDERLDHYDMVVELLPDLVDRLPGFLGQRSRLYGAIAQLRLGDGDEDAIRTTIETVAGAVDTHPSDRFFAAVVLAELSDDPEAALDPLAEEYRSPELVLYRVLLADRIHLARRDETGASSREAYEPYLTLLDETLGLPSDRIRATVLDRLRRAATGDIELASLPPLVAIATADALAMRAETREEAITLFDQVLARPDLDPDDRAAALMGCGRAEHALDRSYDAALRFLTVARELPDQPAAASAIELAATLLTQTLRATPGRIRVASALRETLELLLEHYDDLPSVDSWRYEAGRLAMQEDRFDDAIASFESVAKPSDAWFDAQYLRLATAHRARRDAENESDRTAWSDRVIALEPEVLAVMRREELVTADPGRIAARRSCAAMAHVMVAETLLERGSARRAVEVLDAVDQVAELDPATRAQLLRSRILAFQDTGQTAAVIDEVRRFLVTSPSDASRVLATLLAAWQGDVEAMIEADVPEDDLVTARDELRQLSDLAATWLHEQVGSIDGRALLERTMADAYRVAGDFGQARSLFESLLAGRPNSLPLLFGRAETLYGSGDDLGDAMLIYRRIAASGRESAGRYWYPSQLRMLQILDRMDRNTHQIVPRIEQLRKEDPTLGGPHWERQFNALERKY